MLPNSSLVKEAPTFMPSEAEWREPIQYIQKIRPEAEKAGICRIVPPRTFRPPFAVNKSDFRFRTRVQSLCKLDAIARIEREFMLDLRLSLYRDGTPLGIDPLPMVPATIEGHVEPLRLYRLYQAVEKLGGPVKVNTKNLWLKVVEVMFGKQFAKDQSIAKTLEGAYERYLLKHSMRLCSENPDNKENLKSLVNSADFDMDSIMALALDGIASAQKGKVCGSTSLQTAASANAVGDTVCKSIITEISSDAKRRKIEVAIPCERKLKKPELPKAHLGATFWKFFEDKEEAYFGKVKQRKSGKSDDDPNAIWEIFFRGNGNDRGFSQEIDTEAVVMLMASGETASLAKDAFLEGICQRCFKASDASSLLICDGCNFAYHTNCLDPPLLNIPRGDWFCPICLNTEDDNEENEDAETDIHDLKVKSSSAKNQAAAIEKRRKKQLASFGFGDGDMFYLDEYEGFASRFKKKYLSKVKAANPYASKDLFIKPRTQEEKRKHAEALEAEYWRLISNYARMSDDSELLDLSVSYGSDLDTGELGSGFPTKESTEKMRHKLMKMESEGRNRKWGRGSDKDFALEYSETKRLLALYEKYAESGWNINNLPTLSGSLLQYVDSNITGVMVPWLYVGMCFSSFCWHTEDHNFASINYHHFGAPKTWYGAPGTGAEKFETAARKLAPELFEAREDLLTGIVTQFNPYELAKEGAPIYHLVQNEGDFVITFPRGYHGGFNHGFNCAEAVNFATPDWISFGDQCVERYASLRKTPVISHEALLCSLVVAIDEHGDTSGLASYLFPSINRMIDIELKGRKKIQQFARDIRIENSHPGDTSYQARKEAYSPRSGSTMKRRLPGRKPKSENNVQGRERPSIMGRMQGMSKAYKFLVQCAECKRYCALSFLWSHGTHEGYCLEHGLKYAKKADSALVLIFQKRDFEELQTKLSKFV